MENANHLTIGELARLTSLTRPTIRYYERVGVIPPAARGGTGRYRRYGQSDVERLRFVRRARELGFSLDAVRELAVMASGDRDAPCDDVEQIARTHIADIDARLDSLTAMRAELQRLLVDCDPQAGIDRCSLLSELYAQSSSP
jgi:MerR family transcriptional regulator, mercuric resistance operon regulatory protein